MANFGLKFKEKLYQMYKSKFEQKMGHKFDSEFVPKGDDVETESGYKVDPEFEKTFDKVIHGMNSNNYEKAVVAFEENKSFVWEVDKWFYNWKMGIHQYLVKRTNEDRFETHETEIPFPLIAAIKDGDKSFQCEYPLQGGFIKMSDLW